MFGSEGVDDGGGVATNVVRNNGDKFVNPPLCLSLYTYLCIVEPMTAW